MVRRKIFRRMPLQDVGTRKCSICISLTSVRNRRSGSYVMYYNTKKQQLQMMQKYGMIIHKRVEHTTAGRLDRPEESPGFTEAWQLLTAAGGDPRDSATEIDRRPQQAVRMERRGKSSPAHWRLCGYVNPVRSNNRMGHMWKPRTSRSWRDGPLGPRSFAAT